MIVRTQADAAQLITQPDHAELAAVIMARCRALQDHPRREAILRAVAEHDNGWREEDEAPTVHAETGEVVDFVTAPLAVRHRVWPRGVERLREDPWTAALVAQHAITVYDRYRADRDWDPFFTRMETARDRMLRAANLPSDHLTADYAFVRLGDLISLAFCTGWTEEHRFAEWTVRLEGDRVRVRPDAFEGADIPIVIRARTLRTRAFATDAELRDALRGAAAVELRGVVSGR